MDKQKQVDANAEKLVLLVGKILPYDKRKHKLSGNFGLAINKQAEMARLLHRDWLPLQPDKRQIAELSQFLVEIGADFVDFMGFLFHGQKYWDKLKENAPKS